MPTTPQPPAGPSDPEAAASPGLLRALAGVVAAQGLVLLGLAAFLVVEVARGRGDEGAGPSLLLAAITAAAGGALLVVARGILQRRRWSRAPALVTQFIALPVGSALFGTQAAVGVLVMVVAVATVVLLLAPGAGGQLQR